MNFKKNAVSLILIGAMAFWSGGCASARKKTTHQKVVTGLYKNSLETLVSNFARIKERVTTRQELEEMGFTLKKVPNMSIFEGVPAFEELFGKEGLRNADLKQPLELLGELGLYTLYKIPYKDVTTTSDRIYMNRQKIEVKGPDMLFIIILRDGHVVYAKKNMLYNNTVEYRKRIFGGPIDLINEASGAIKAGINGL